MPEFSALERLIQENPNAKLGALIAPSSETWDGSPDMFGDVFPYIEISAVGLGTNEYSVEEIAVASAPSRAKMIVRSGDIILSTTRPHRGAIAEIREDDDGSIASTGFAILRELKTDTVTREYLLNVLNSSLVLRQFLQRSSGGNYPAITPEEIDKVLIPRPTKKVQQALVTLLQKARAARQQKLAQADGLLAGMDNYLLSQVGITAPAEKKQQAFAVRLKDIDGPLNAERYFGLHLHKYIKGTVIDKIANVLDVKVAPSREAPNNEWDWIRIDDLPNQPLEVENIRTMPGAEIDGTFFEVQGNDILLARLGPTILNAKFVLCPKTKRRTVASGEFLVLRCREGWNPLVVLWTLRTKLFRDLMYSKGRGGTPSRYRVNREDLIALPFPEISEKTRDVLIPEIKRRLETTRRLRAEAATEWAAAKAQFEQKLLGENAKP